MSSRSRNAVALIDRVHGSLDNFLVTISYLNAGGLPRESFSASGLALFLPLSLSLFQCSRGAFSLLPSKSPRLFPLCFHDVKFLECHPNCNKVFFGVLLHRPLLPSTTAASATISTTFSSSPSSTSSVAFSLLVHARLEGVTMPRSGPPRRGTVVTISNEMKY